MARKWVPLRMLCFVFWVGVLAALCGGCAKSRTEMLERVAKDWSETVRASQIVPAYPLVEDLFPGDVFLVDTPAQKVHEQYRDKKLAFLPMDWHLTRLPVPPETFRKTYSTKYLNHAFAETPHNRTAAADGGGKDGGSKDGSGKDGSGKAGNAKDGSAKDGGDSAVCSYSTVPNAAFLSYTFELSRGGGLNLALPVYGVPIAFGLLSGEKATGTLSIKQALTYHVSSDLLLDELRAWHTKERKAMLATIASSGNSTRYLRVINRVFLAGAVAVTLNHAGDVGATLKAGSDLTDSTPGYSLGGRQNATSAFENAETLNNSLKKIKTLASGYGGDISFTQASRYSISLDETFPAPLVIGYHGFDLPIGPDGSLGAPISTYIRTEGQASLDDPHFFQHTVLQDAKYIDSTLVGLPPQQRMVVIATIADATPHDLFAPYRTPKWCNGNMTQCTELLKQGGKEAAALTGKMNLFRIQALPLYFMDTQHHGARQEAMVELLNSLIH